MSRKVYVIVESNFEYNDEFYYKSGCVEPVEAYLSREKALEVALQKTKEFLDSNSDEHYKGSPFDVVEMTIEDAEE